MKRLLLILFGLTVLLAANVTHAQPPPNWALLQNDPDPFCNELNGTNIRYTLPQQCHVLLRIWDPDTSTVVRILVNGLQSSGFHEVVWDGRNGFGALLPNGAYPYNLTATESGGGSVLFRRTLVASVYCVPGVITVETWSKIKALFVE